MGQTLASLFSGLFKNKEARILMVGLDAAGTLLYRLAPHSSPVAAWLGSNSYMYN